MSYRCYEPNLYVWCLDTMFTEVEIKRLYTWRMAPDRRRYINMVTLPEMNLMYEDRWIVAKASWQFTAEEDMSVSKTV